MEERAKFEIDEEGTTTLRVKVVGGKNVALTEHDAMELARAIVDNSPLKDVGLIDD